MKQRPALGLATVYRNPKRLLAEGECRPDGLFPRRGLASVYWAAEGLD
jgi:hypothetical protein